MISGILVMGESICYNANGKMLRVSMVIRKMKTPEVATPGFSFFKYNF